MIQDLIRNQMVESLSLTLEQLGCEKLERSVVASTLTRPPESDKGEFAFPVFRFAKACKMAPPQLAAKVAENYASYDRGWVGQAEAAGPFVNFRLDRRKFAEWLLSQATDIEAGMYYGGWETAPRRKMVEFSQPNTHKEFHVGHGRNMCLGDSICRLFEYVGHEVQRVNYFGDEGTHVAKCLWAIQKNIDSKPQEGLVEWYGKQYVAATNEIKAADDEEKKRIMEAVSAILRDIEQKNEPVYSLWQETRKDCLDEFASIYKRFDVAFHHDFFESEVSLDSQALVDEFAGKGVFTESDGALGVDLSDDKLGYFIARKRDGNTLYGTKDLALAKRKFEEFAVEDSLYVVANEQNHHFKQVFRVLELMGFEQAQNCHHINYGLVVRRDGKMSSREGNSFTFHQLEDTIKDALATHLSKYSDIWTPKQMQMVAHQLTVGTIRYGMLVTDPSKDVVFEPEIWTAFEGQTGPYLMYSHARSCSILRKAREQDKRADLARTHLLTADQELRLLTLMHDLPGVIDRAAETCKPSLVAQHLFDLCKSFNRFYKECPILSAESEELAAARLSLTDGFREVLVLGLRLLGIDPPSQM